MEVKFLKNYKKQQIINVVVKLFFMLIIFYAMISYSVKRYLLNFNSKTSIGIIYNKGITSTKSRCIYFYLFVINNKMYSGHLVDGNKSCNDWNIGQKGIVTFDVDNPKLNEIDFSINPESEYLDSIYKYHILFKSKGEIKNLFYEK
jgi:hypothetical protein